MNIIEFLSQPWPWYVAGPLITFSMFLIMWLGKRFGISTSLKVMCTYCGAKSVSNYFNIDWKSYDWLITFVVGTVIGGFIAGYFLADPNPIDISASTIQDLEAIGLAFDGNYIPTEIFNFNELLTIRGFIFMVIGGFFIGFGTRYAEGCTSGHAITGLSNLQWTSLIAVIGFFIGGLTMTHLLLPYLMNL